MMLSKLTNVAALVIGLVLALAGAAALVAADTGAISPDGNAGVVAGAYCLLFAAPLVAYPFSKRSFRRLGVVALLALALGLLYLSFQLDVPAARPSLYQAGAIALPVLLVARIVLGVRAQKSRKDV